MHFSDTTTHARYVYTRLGGKKNKQIIALICLKLDDWSARKRISPINSLPDPTETVPLELKVLRNRSIGKGGVAARWAGHLGLGRDETLSDSVRGSFQLCI